VRSPSSGRWPVIARRRRPPPVEVRRSPSTRGRRGWPHRTERSIRRINQLPRSLLIRSRRTTSMRRRTEVSRSRPTTASCGPGCRGSRLRPRPPHGEDVPVKDAERLPAHDFESIIQEPSKVPSGSRIAATIEMPQQPAHRTPRSPHCIQEQESPIGLQHSVYFSQNKLRYAGRQMVRDR
jgi:hypothetical protein